MSLTEPVGLGTDGALAGNTPNAEYDGSVQLSDMGCEGVGVVSAVGEGVTGLAVGQALAFMGYGLSFREYVTLSTKGDVAHSLVSFAVPDAAAKWVCIPCSALTATGGLELEGQISALPPGSAVLVTGAAGGTGHIAVQWAKLKGMRVAGTCGSDAKAAMLKDLGCDVTVNYKSENVTEALKKEFPDGFALVYEGVGGEIGRTAQRLVSPGGRLVSIGAVSTDYSSSSTAAPDEEDVMAVSPSMSATEFAGKTLTGFFMPAGPTYEGWEALKAETVAAVTEGKVKVHMDSGCAKFAGLEGVYQAQARMRLGENAGKIYATIDPELCAVPASL